MKNLILSALLFLCSLQVFSHGVQVAYEVKDNGSLRVWIEHWHGSGMDVSSFPLEIEFYQNSELISSETYYANGTADSTPLDSLPIDQILEVISVCPDANNYNDWVYWDFFPAICNEVIDIVIVSGPAAETEEACGNLYPQTISRDFTDIYAPSLSIDTLYLNPSTDCTGEFLLDLPADVLSDNCDPNPVVSYSPAIGSFFPLGASTVYVTATDINGNTANDSLIIFINPVNSTIYEVAMDSFEWKGNSYTQTGIYQESLETTVGCDSLVFLDLIIFDNPYANIPDGICYDNIGSEFEINSQLEVTGTGIINDSVFSTLGFIDSTYNLTALFPNYSQNGLNFDKYISDVSGQFNYIDIDNVADTIFELYDNNVWQSNFVPIGFEFVFNGSEFDSLFIERYTYMVFDENWNNYIFSADISDFHADSTNGSFKYATVGTAPNRVFIAEFENVFSLVNNDTIYFNAQTQLFEGSNKIEFHIKNMNFMGTGYSGAQGLESYNSNSGDFIDYYTPGREWSNWHMATNDFASFTPAPTINKTFQVFSETPDSSVVSISACESYEFNSNTYTENGIYIDHVINEFGCFTDIVTTDLTILNGSLTNQSFTFSYLEDSVVVGQNVYYDLGVYTDIFVGSNGCDSVVISDLTVYYFVDSTQNITICEGQTISVNENLYGIAGTYVDTIDVTGAPNLILTTELMVNPSPEVATIEQYYSTTFKTDESNSYQWYLNGEELEAETSQFCNFSVGGIYTVERINTFDCKTMSEEFVIGSLDRVFKSEMDFMLYPNPTNQFLNIELQEELGTEYIIVVSDLTGRDLLNFNGAKNNTLRPIIDLNNLAKGSYQITVKYSNGTALSKTVIKN